MAFKIVFKVAFIESDSVTAIIIIATLICVSF